MQIPGMELLAGLGDQLVLAGEAAAWMSANWGNPEIWETEGDALREHYGGLASAMQMAMEAWTTVSSGISAVSGGVETVRGTLEPLATNPLFLATLLLPGLNLFTVATLLLTEADDPLWAELWSAGTTAVGWIAARTEPVGEVIAAIAALLVPPGSLTVVPGVVLGAITLLPECYQIPIIDLLITLVGTAAAVITMPFVLAGPISAPINGSSSSSRASVTPRRWRCSPTSPR